MMKTGLDRIEDFGGTDADGDELLTSCFEDHPGYLAVRNHTKFLVRGRKGAGKTAIFKRLLREAGPKVFASGYSFEDYPWPHHAFQEETGVPSERRYVHSWKYLILLGLAQTVLEASHRNFWSEDQAVFDALTSLEDFLVDSYGSSKPGLNELFNPKGEIRIKAKFKLGIVDVEGQRVPMAQFPAHIQAVNRQIENDLFTAMDPLAEYFVCFDQLDHGFSTADPSYHDRIAGLLIAARSLFRNAKDRKLRFNPVVLLRDDIFESLHFEDRNRIRADSYLLEWSPDGPGVTLKSLMESRFRVLLGTTEKPDVTWDEVFDESERMTGHQTKLAHISDRTYLRPRDMIQFCNLILAAYKRDENHGSLVGNAALKEARRDYSPYLLDEMDDEIKKHVPSYMEYLKVIQAIGSEKFTVAQFKTAFEARCPLEEMEGALSSLFQFSVIGFLRPGGAGGGSTWVWRYTDSRETFDQHAVSFQTHRGLKEALGLVR